MAGGARSSGESYYLDGLGLAGEESSAEPRRGSRGAAGKERQSGDGMECYGRHGSEEKDGRHMVNKVVQARMHMDRIALARSGGEWQASNGSVGGSRLGE
jgi:hypothetical protein